MLTKTIDGDQPDPLGHGSMEVRQFFLMRRFFGQLQSQTISFGTLIALPGFFRPLFSLALRYLFGKQCSPAFLLLAYNALGTLAVGIGFGKQLITTRLLGSNSIFLAPLAGNTLIGQTVPFTVQAVLPLCRCTLLIALCLSLTCTSLTRLAKYRLLLRIHLSIEFIEIMYSCTEGAADNRSIVGLRSSTVGLHLREPFGFTPLTLSCDETSCTRRLLFRLLPRQLYLGPGADQPTIDTRPVSLIFP
ncbi:hypothetical protein ASR47_1001279 [Janthinobacterium psychrotolerans]|uniref:Uncharacterized protein n=1 Tax=Janthinobacterium psychrotolerans TaxID=1747903 RepID=A0A1A7BWA7_9BURK|nr:hypothetical protein ASR47_1001279 [Janthinobacterium psychrotolerans]